MRTSASNREDKAKTDYGLAYKDSYEGGFYYGDLKDENSELPNCFEEDIECQNVASSRERLMLSILFIIIALVLGIIIAAYCY